LTSFSIATPQKSKKETKSCSQIGESRQQVLLNLPYNNQQPPRNKARKETRGVSFKTQEKERNGVKWMLSFLEVPHFIESTSWSTHLSGSNKPT